MKNITTKHGRKNSDEKQPIVLIGNTYRKSPNPLFILITRMLLTYIISAGTIMSFVGFYNIPYELSVIILQILLFVTAFFPVFILTRKRIILPAIAAFSAIIYYFLHEIVNSAVLLFVDHFLINIDSRLLHTIQFVPKNSLAFLTRTQDFISEMNLFMLIFSLVICILCVTFCYKKFNIIGIIVMWVVLFTPAFIAEKAELNTGIFLIVTGFVGLIVINSSNSYFSLQAESTQEKKETAIRAATRSLLHYGKNSICGIIAGAIAISIFFCSSLIFPEGKAFNTDEVINGAVDFFTDIGDYFSVTFAGGSTGNGFFSDYFSSDNFLISNDIELSIPPINKGDKVLEISSDTPNGLYLIGDIGVDYTGNSWISIQKMVERNKLYSGSYNISDSFQPEIIYQVYLANAFLYCDDYYYNNSNQSGYNAEQVGKHYINYNDYNYIMENMPGEADFLDRSCTEIIELLSQHSNVSIRYSKNTNIVFKPFMPASATYRDNPSFVTYGDGIIRLANKKDWIKNFDTSVVAPFNSIWFATTEHQKLLSEQFPIEIILEKMDMSAEEISRYKTDKSEYDRYVYDTYTNVPDSEKAVIRRFLNEFENSGNGKAKVKDIKTTYLYVYAMNEYLKNNYEYSLTAGNKADADTTLLESFLFENKKGHCALYASSMVLALREKGIPSRYVSGFSTGSLYDNTENRDTNKSEYEKSIYENDLHAWVEVYFEDTGWMAFDPTGWGGNENFGNNPFSPDNSATTVPTSPPNTTTTTTTAPVITTTSNSNTSSDIQTTAPPEPSGDTSSGNDNITQQYDYTALIIVLVSVASVIVIALCIYALYSYSVKKNRRRMRKFRSGEATASVKDMHDFIMKLFDVTDIRPLKTELPTEFADRIDKMMKISGMNNNLAMIMQVIEKAEFSDIPITENERQAVFTYTKMLYDLVLDNAGKVKRLYLLITL